MSIRRNRLHYAMFTGVVIIAGCASRSSLSDSWPAFITEYAGDTLWTLMIFLGLGFLFPTMRTWKIAAVALLFSYGVEISQLYQADWINSFRNTFLGAVILGSGFLWSDFVCYTVGCGIGVLGEVCLREINRGRHGKGV